MGTIRRFGPGLIGTQITPRPELGRGSEAAFGTFSDMFAKANEFIRPAVIQEQTLKGEEQAIEAINNNTFEVAQPYTVRSQAFNAAADRIITTETMVELDSRVRGALQRADGNMATLQGEMAKVRDEIAGKLPDLPGLATDFEEAFLRVNDSAERNTADLARRRAIARDKAAAAAALDAANAQVETLALTGATGDEIAAHLATTQDQVAQFGPREEFTLNGVTYPADPKRAALFTLNDINGSMQDMVDRGTRLTMEANFQLSDSPGAMLQEFREITFAGDSPLSAGDSLEAITKWSGRIYTAESRRVTAANKEMARLAEETNETINTYVTLTEAGVPVAIPQDERAAIMANLAPFPDQQREAEIAFAVADAAVETFGMNGAQLTEYTESIRADIATAAEGGVFDLAGAEVLNSLQDNLKKLSDAVTTESIGLPLIDQLVRDGADLASVDYDELREQSGGNQDVLNAINETEAFHRDVEALQNLTGAEREQVLNDLRAKLQEVAAMGEGMGSAALKTQEVLASLDDWSADKQELAQTDSMAFAASIGVEMPEFTEEMNMGQIGTTIAGRVRAISGASQSEGVDLVTPLRPNEIAALTESFTGAPKSQQLAFIGEISDLGQDQAAAIFEQVGQSNPVLFSAGVVYAGGNYLAANTILNGQESRGVSGGSTLDVATARSSAIGDLVQTGWLTPKAMENLETTALAYARGLSEASGGTDLTQKDLQEGFLIATGRQPDGTGGFFDTRYGATILPPTWDDGRLEREIKGIDDAELTELSKSVTLIDARGTTYDADRFKDEIERLRPTDDPMVFIPLDRESNFFTTGEGEIFSINLGDFEAKQVSAELQPKNTGLVTEHGRPIFENASGDRFSEISITIQNSSGKWLNVPTVGAGGVVLDGGIVEQFYFNRPNPVDPITGKSIQQFSNQSDALSAARARSDNMQQLNK